MRWRGRSGPAWAAALLCAFGLWATGLAAHAGEAVAPRAEVLVLLKLAPEHYRPGADYGGGYGDDLAKGARRRLAQRIAHDHQLGVVTSWPMPLLGLDCYVMSVPDGRSAETVAAGLSREPGVAWSEPVHRFRGEGAVATHNDPLFLAQPAARVWRLAELHRFATGRGVSVAVIDSQVDRSHPDLAGQIAVAEDFVGDGARSAEAHGTEVAGVIAAKADNRLGIAGVAPNARLMALRSCWQAGPGAGGTVCDSLSLAKGLHFAIDHRAQVINLSLGGPPDRLVATLLDAALARGIAVVAAYDKALPRGGFPAMHPGVIAVADDAVAELPRGVYTAPGRDVPTTGPGARWVLVNGSSYAAAHVSGLVALQRERGGRAGVRLVAARHDGGAVDACASLLRSEAACVCACAVAGQATPLVGR